MNLRDAVLSGKPFRHNDWNESYFTNAHELEIDLANGFRDAKTTLKELISDGWEIQGKQTFTREDVQHAIDVAIIGKKLGNSDAKVMLDAFKAAEGA